MSSVRAADNSKAVLTGGQYKPDSGVETLNLYSKLIAVFDEQEPLQKIECPSGNPVDRQSPDAFETEVAAQLAAFKPIGGEIVVTPSALKLASKIGNILNEQLLRHRWAAGQSSCWGSEKGHDLDCQSRGPTVDRTGLENPNTEKVDRISDRK
ncbi:hypothetical protein ACRRTK_000019 [Alexandromys fortis]